MNKNIKILICIIVVLITGSLITYFTLNKEDEKEYVITADGLQFKNEYENLNGQINENNDKEYLSINIKAYNTIKYSSYEEIFNILENGSGVIYFGFPECPWCRNLVPVLTDSAIEYELDNIYYLNIVKDRNTLSLNKKGKIQTDKAGTEDYTKLVEKLAEFLPAYTGLKDETIKRVYLPTVVFVKDGKVLGIEQSLETFSKRVEGDGYLPMNAEEKTSLGKIFTNYYKQIEAK